MGSSRGVAMEGKMARVMRDGLEEGGKRVSDCSTQLHSTNPNIIAVMAWLSRLGIRTYIFSTRPLIPSS